MGVKEVMVGIAAVFDGHNGAEASEMASKLLVEYFVLHTYFLLDATYSSLLKTSSGRLPHKRDGDEVGHLHKWEEIPSWDELHFGRYFYISRKSILNTTFLVFKIDVSWSASSYTFRLLGGIMIHIFTSAI